jgi:DNA ligase 1
MAKLSDLARQTFQEKLNGPMKRGQVIHGVNEEGEAFSIEYRGPATKGTPPLLWKFLLATALPPKYDLNLIPYPVYASPKIDGVRGGVQNGVVVSRNGRPLANRALQAKYGRPEYEGLDVEFTAGVPWGQDVFNKTVRITQKKDAPLGDLRANVIDWYGDLDFANRVGCAKERYGCDAAISLIKQMRIASAKQLQVFEEKCLAKGYEGVMLRKADSGAYPQKPGKDNRSTVAEFDLVKMKRFDFSEARILQRFDLMHNTNEDRVTGGRRSSKKSGMVADTTKTGSVRVMDTKSGAEFDLKVATEVAQTWPGWHQAKYWSKKVIRYKFFPSGCIKAPRFPTANFKELTGA